MILKVQHAQITIPPGEEAAARAFYCGLLGLREMEKPESLRGRGGFWMEINGFQIHVGTESDFDRIRTKAHLAYQVTGLDDWRKKLVERGVGILDGIEIPDFRRFEFRDPFGNRVEFLEYAGVE